MVDVLVTTPDTVPAEATEELGLLAPVYPLRRLELVSGRGATVRDPQGRGGRGPPGAGLSAPPSRARLRPRRHGARHAGARVPGLRERDRGERARTRAAGRGAGDRAAGAHARSLLQSVREPAGD